jgi:hypothetical protein
MVKYIKSVNVYPKYNKVISKEENTLDKDEFDITTKD